MSVIETKRRKGESFEAMLRRFGRRVMQSGKILQARKIRFHKADPSKNKLKAAAVRRKEIQEKRQYLMRTGQLVEEKRRRGRRRR